MKKLRNEELNRVTPQEYDKLIKTPLTIVLDNVRSLNNIGSVFRTADCYRVEKIILCGITAQPPHKEIRKTALGATETVDWDYEDETLDAVQKLQRQGYTVCAIEQAVDAISLHESQFDQQQKVAIVLGNEVKGVQQKVVNACDKVIELEQYGTKHSLNISVCTGIVVYDLFYKLK
ncbi:MAG: RNA methyltransferase [Nonlabens sp.]